MAGRYRGEFAIARLLQILSFVLIEYLYVDTGEYCLNMFSFIVWLFVEICLNLRSLEIEHKEGFGCM